MKTRASECAASQAGTGETDVDPLRTSATQSARGIERPDTNAWIATEPSTSGVTEGRKALRATRNVPVTAWPNRFTHRPTTEFSGNPEKSPFQRTSDRPDTLTPVTTNCGCVVPLATTAWNASGLACGSNRCETIVNGCCGRSPTTATPPFRSSCTSRTSNVGVAERMSAPFAVQARSPRSGLQLKFNPQPF